MLERRPYELVLDFTNAIDMGFYQTIDYSRASTEASPSGTKTQTEITYDIRYTVNAYRIDGNDGNRLSDTTVVVCNSDLENLNHTLRLNLRPGKYRFLVWADYVVHGTKTDLYYNTSNFDEIILADRQNHTGSTDRRDAFRGEKEAEVYDNPELTSNSTRSTAVGKVQIHLPRHSQVSQLRAPATCHPPKRSGNEGTARSVARVCRPKGRPQSRHQEHQHKRLPRSVPLPRLHAVLIQYVYQQASRLLDRRRVRQHDAAA